MLFWATLALAATTPLDDDFEDGAGGTWRTVSGNWVEAGGSYTGELTEVGPGVLAGVDRVSWRDRVSFSFVSHGPGTAGVIYAYGRDATYCGVFYGHGDVWFSTEAGEVRAVDGTDPGTNPSVVVVVDVDHVWVTVDGTDVYVGDNACRVAKLSGEIGLTALANQGAASFDEFHFAVGGRDRDGDGTVDDDDCAPDDATISGDLPEIWYDGIDENCDGRDDYDRDGDGVDLEDDCDDTDPYSYPGAQDLWYDGRDSDCAGNDDYDADGDGADFNGVGGTDCDDGDATTYPGAPTDEHDGIDHDCDGFIPAPGSGEDTGGDPAAIDTGSGNTGGGDGKGCGCDTTPGAGAGMAALGLVLAARRRR